MGSGWILGGHVMIMIQTVSVNAVRQCTGFSLVSNKVLLLPSSAAWLVTSKNTWAIHAYT